MSGQRLLIITFSRNESFSSVQNMIDISLAFRDSELSTKDVLMVHVDDGSSDEQFVDLLSQYRKNKDKIEFSIIRRPENYPSGICGSILFGMNEFPEFELVLPIPGHHMFHGETILDLVRSSRRDMVVIGIRSNLKKTRPFGKYISSVIFNYAVRKFVNLKEIKDIHGLHIYPYEILQRTLPISSPHENHLIPLTYMKRYGIPFVSVKVNLRLEHKSESIKIGRRKWPKYRDIIDKFVPIGDLAVALTKRGLTDRHWKELLEKTGIDCTPKEGFTFKNIVEKGMQKYIEICAES